MSTQTLEQCALKPLTYYNGCRNCPADNPTKMCYVSYEELERHLTDFRNLFSPMVQRFYQKYGNSWREQARSLK